MEKTRGSFLSGIILTNDKKIFINVYQICTIHAWKSTQSCVVINSSLTYDLSSYLATTSSQPRACSQDTRGISGLYYASARLSSCHAHTLRRSTPGTNLCERRKLLYSLSLFFFHCNGASYMHIFTIQKARLARSQLLISFVRVSHLPREKKHPLTDSCLMARLVILFIIFIA